MTTQIPGAAPSSSRTFFANMSPQRGAFAVVTAYASGALVWILLSDSLLGLFVSDPDAVLHLGMIKGTLFVIVSAGILYFMVRAMLRRSTSFESVARELQGSQQEILDLIPLPVFVNAADGSFSDLNSAALDLLDIEKEEVLGLHPRDFVAPKDIDAVSASVRRALAGENGDVACRIVTKDGEMPFEVFARPLWSGSGEVQGVIAIAVDLTDKLRAKSLSQSRFSGYRDMMVETSSAIASLLEARDPSTAGHQKRVGRIALDIALQLGIPKYQQEGLHLAAILHDIGKIGVPIELLVKPGRLTPSEREVIANHVEISHAVLKDLDFPWPVADMIHHHHERLDGSGYPQGLKGDRIPTLSRILIVADVADAMTSHRPYRPALAVQVAIEELEANSGKLYDPDVVRACIVTLAKPEFANA